MSHHEVRRYLFCYKLLLSVTTADGAIVGGEQLENVTFAHNVATAGGTMYWVYATDAIEPPGLDYPTVIWSNNEAPYGLTVATQAIKLITPDTYEVTVYGGDINPPLSVYMRDYYGNQVVSLTNDTSVFMTIYTMGVKESQGHFLTMPECLGLNPSIAGNDLLGVALFNGYARFTQTQLYCNPLGNYTVQFDAQLGDLTSIPSNIASDYYLTNYTFITFRACREGEYERNGQCVTCPSGSYSLSSSTDVTGDSCQDCSKTAGVDDCYGNQLILFPGYWRRYPTSTAVMSCPYGSMSCLGGNMTGQALCAVGYTGPLCSVCDNGYYLSDGASCQSCKGNHIMSTTLIATVSVVSVMVILLLIVYYFGDLILILAPQQHLKLPHLHLRMRHQQ